MNQETQEVILGIPRLKPGEDVNIAEAKQGLAAHLGVSPECIQIFINA